LTVVLCLLALALSSRSAAGPVPSTTFNKDIAPILFEHCSGCHRPGEAAPFSLLTYDDARRRARQIEAATASGYMPPWKPSPGHGEFARSRRLTATALDLIRQWVEQGAVEGNPADLPSAPRWPGGWQLGPPDLVVAMADGYRLRSDGADVFRTFVIPIPAMAEARYIEGMEFRSTGTAALHHANVKIDPSRASRRLDDEEAGPGFEGGSSREARFPDGHFLGWTPGQTPQMLSDTAWRLPADSDLVIEAHMTPTGKPESVQVSVGLYFADKPPARLPSMIRLGSQRIDIPAGVVQYESTDSYVLPVDVEVLRVQPHAHHLARKIEGMARLPDGTTEWLIDIEDWDFKWQDVYEYARPLALPAGTTLTMKYSYDNSAANPRNPHRPPRRVTFGQTTSSEMGDLWLQVMTRSAGDRLALDGDYAPKMLAEDIAGVEKALELTPDLARLHADLGLCYIEAGRIPEALAALERSVRLDPRSASAHYDLGTLLLRERRFAEARDHFESAVRLKPGFAEAHNNLGVAQVAQGGIEEAVRSYREALRLMPDHAEAHYNLARALAAGSHVDEAVAHYREALARLPGDAEVHASLASLLATHGRVEEAIAHYRQALDANPDLPAALTDLAWILATSERNDLRAPVEAVRLAEQVAGQTGYRDATILDTLAAAYFAAGRTDRAIATARTALEAAMAGGGETLASRIRERLKFYEQQAR
jgi:tetratricopeptide (TPR) repeat protein